MHKSILIIDDDDYLSNLLMEFLQLKGFIVYREPDGPSGAAKAREILPDLITLDFNMPGVTGVETYKELRQYPATAVIPILFFSSTLLGLIKRLLTDNDRVRFLKKGCQTTELERCVNEMLALPKLTPPPHPFHNRRRHPR
ncbi:MAG: response regulator [Elusimicrobiota bacterium]